MTQAAPIAALDIGSNSFQLIVARVISGRLEVLHKEKIKVHLAAGLDQAGYLSEAALARAELALIDFAQTLTGFNPSRVKIVATYTVRTAKNKQSFLQRARAILPFDIDVVSGFEEARLIYQGVCNYHHDDNLRLVIDMGGGSTEFIIGQQSLAHLVASRDMGCVTYQAYFTNGKLSEQSFNNAIIAASQALEPIVNQYLNMGWQTVLGTSGSFKALHAIATNSFNQAELTLTTLNKMKHKLIEFGDVQSIELAGLTDERKSIIAPALAIAIACFEMLNLQQLEYCDYSLREGVLHELINQNHIDDLKAKTISNFAARFNCDLAQGQRVKAMLEWLLRQVKDSWQFEQEQVNLLMYGAEIFEVGLSISASGVHKHSAYIVENSVLPGFNQEAQSLLTVLIRNYRKKIKPQNLNCDSDIAQPQLLRLICIFRLAHLFTQKRQCEFAKIESIAINGDIIDLRCDPSWLHQQALLHADLLSEAGYLKNYQIGFLLNGVSL